MDHLPCDHDLRQLNGEEEQHKQNREAEHEFQQDRTLAFFQK